MLQQELLIYQAQQATILLPIQLLLLEAVMLLVLLLQLLLMQQPLRLQDSHILHQFVKIVRILFQHK